MSLLQTHFVYRAAIDVPSHGKIMVRKDISTNCIPVHNLYLPMMIKSTVPKHLDHGWLFLKQENTDQLWQ